MAYSNRDQEEWRPAPGFPAYEVSSFGRVRNPRTGRVLRQNLTASGYPRITLTRDGAGVSARVHRLVCEAFHGPAPEGKPWVLHWDDTPTNNRASNLRWGSPSENANDALRNGAAPGRWNDAVCRAGLHPWIKGVTTTFSSEGRDICQECIREAWRRSRTEGLPEGDPRHGTIPGGRKGCRCDACAPVWRAYRSEKGRQSYLRSKESSVVQ